MSAVPRERGVSLNRVAEGVSFPTRRNVLPGREVFDQINKAKEAVEKKAMPSAVSIVSVVPDFDPRERAPRQNYTNVGAGFVVSVTDDEVLIATNRHVYDETKKQTPHAKIFVESSHKSPNGSLREKALFESAHIVYRSKDHDVAFIAIDPREHPEVELPVVTLGSGKNLRVGQTIVTIGAPWSFGDTTSFGEVSNDIVMEIQGSYGTNPGIQVNAATRPGNSGGMAIDAVTDEVIGVPTTAVIGDSSTGFITIIDVFKSELEKFQQGRQEGKEIEQPVFPDFSFTAIPEDTEQQFLSA